MWHWSIYEISSRRPTMSEVQAIGYGVLLLWGVGLVIGALIIVGRG